MDFWEDVFEKSLIWLLPGGPRKY